MNPLLCLLVTSRTYLSWSGEVGLKHDLTGLAPAEGASLFQQSAPQRMSEVNLAEAEQLSQKVGGHPLSLRLLGGAFNASTITLPAFIRDCETQLLQAENKYLGPEHRQRTLYACIDTSVRYLDDELRTLLSKLWIFHAPFLPQIAVEICDPTEEQTEDTRSPVYDQLFALRQRGLLNLEETTLREGMVQLYRLLPTIRPYIEHYLARAEEREQLLARFGKAYAGLVRFLHDELKRSGIAAFMAVQCREDLERGMSSVTGVTQGYYLLDWGWVLWRLIDSRHGLALTEQALEMGQSLAQQSLKLEALNNLALVYQGIGQPQRALALCEQALPLRREVGDRAGEAATLNNLALVYQGIGQPQRALALCEQALPLRREVGDRAGEAATLNGLAYLFMDMQHYKDALTAFEQSVELEREVNHPAGEVAGLVGLARLLYQHLNRR